MDSLKPSTKPSTDGVFNFFLYLLLLVGITTKIIIINNIKYGFGRWWRVWRVWRSYNLFRKKIKNKIFQNKKVYNSI